MDDSILCAMRSVEMSLSPFQQQSLISRINRNETDSVDALIAKVLTESQRINRLSNGLFDPTVAPLVNLWGFGYEKSLGEPTQDMIDSCLMSVGIAECKLVDGALAKKSPDTQFNFSAITKGFGCDCVAEALAEVGCRDFMVEIGGEVVVRGSNSRGSSWRVMVDAPIDGNLSHEGVAVIEVTDCGIATSGNYRNFRDTSAGRIGHTISPLTGTPIMAEVLSVTVIAPSAMTADALATACMAMPLHDAKAMIESAGDGVSAMFVLRDDDGWNLVATSGFPELIQFN